MKTTITEIAAGVHQMVVGEGAHAGVYAPNRSIWWLEASVRQS